MGDCKHCRYAIYDPLWTEYKCALKHFDIPNPPEEFSCKSYQKGRPRHSRFWKEPKLRKPGDKVIIENGTFYADGDLMTGYRSVTVKVPESKDPVLQDKTATENGIVKPDEGYDGLSSVVVQIPDPVLQDKTVNQNGIVTADEGYYGLSSVSVEIPDPVLQEKTIDITNNGTYTIVADATHDGLVKVIINVDIEHTNHSTTAIVGRAVVGYAIVGEG